MNIIPQHREGVTFFTCDSFGPGVAHGFSSRVGGVSPPPWDSLNLGAGRGDQSGHVTENFRRFLSAIGAEGAAVVKNHQVHGAKVRAVTRKDEVDPGRSGLTEADALITNEPGVCLCAFSADCIPILLYDPRARAVGAVHAGWRGTAAGAVFAAVEAMIHTYGCRAEDILAAIGPGIGPCCFETHADVPDGLRAGMGEEAEAFITPIGERPGKFRVDLKGANRGWLLRSGVLPGHIALSPLCTACHPDLFWSHRLVGERRGSMAGAIALTGEAGL